MEKEIKAALDTLTELLKDSNPGIKLEAAREILKYAGIAAQN